MKIALAGQARTGKDTVAHYLVNKYHFTEYKFSKGIHDVIDLVRGKTDAPKNRSELQGIGQGLRCILGEDSWVNYTLSMIESELEQPTHIVISDCRQKNERDILVKEGYTIIKVESDIHTRIGRMNQEGDIFNEDDLSHETEKIDFDTDFVITNNGTLDELYQQIEAIIQEIEYGKTN